MHRIHYKVNNITSGSFIKAASIHKHNTRYSDKGNYYIQTTNLSLGRKAINVTGPVSGPKFPHTSKNIPQKQFQEKDHLISKQQGTITT